ncbi:MAG: aldehyde dehydrogenase family protein, partial [Amphiplicatus sp.]
MTQTVFINGEWREGRGAKFQSFDPSTGEIVYEGAAATRDDVSEAVSAAHAAFPAWATTPVKERIAIMERYRDIIRHNADELAR